MLGIILRRFLSLVLSLIVASAVIFSVVELAPGDPARFMLGLNASEDTVAALRRELGLDQTAFARYLSWVGGLLSGDFGISYTYRTPIADMVAERLKLSVPLALYAISLTVFLAFPVGLIAAAHKDGLADGVIMALTQIGIAIPNFWFAVMLVLVFAISLGWLPPGGFPGWDDGVWPALRALTLPAFALALPQAAILARVLRGAILDVLGEDFIRTARAKGLSKGQVLWRHALRNALIPVLTILGLQIAFLIAGAIIIEQVFYLPGLGRLIFQAMTQRDLLVVETVVMILVFAVIFINFLVEIAYAWVDPRLRSTQ